MISFAYNQKFKNLKDISLSNNTGLVTNISEIVRKTNQLQEEHFSITIPELEERLQALKKSKFQIKKQYVISYIHYISSKICMISFLPTYSLIMILALVIAVSPTFISFFSAQAIIILAINVLFIFLVTVLDQNYEFGWVPKVEECQSDIDIINNCTDITEAFLKALLKIKEAIPEHIPTDIKNIILIFSSSIEIEKTNKGSYKGTLENSLPPIRTNLALEYI